MSKAVPISFAERAALLEQARTLKMAQSAHAFVRGNTAQFYEWLAELDPRGLPEGPPVWICGDCHLGNLGPLADADYKVDIQIRDLDQTVIGNPAHDLIRLGLSLASAARGSDLPGVTTARMIEEMVRGYTLALVKPRAHAALPEPDAVRTVRRRALGRSWRHLARERIEDVEPRIPIGRKFWSLTNREWHEIAALFEAETIKTLVLALNQRAEGEIKLVDAAYWMKGCSSLGKLRFAAIVEVTGREGAKYALVDLKEAVDSAAPASKGASMPVHKGERVVAGARALSPNLGNRMIGVDLLGKPVVMRELMPQDLKLEVDQFTHEEAVRAACYLSFAVGRAHARQMDRRTRTAWRATLGKWRRGEVDAPSWLWSSIVALAARHEAGYLEHCRRYAMAHAA